MVSSRTSGASSSLSERFEKSGCFESLPQDRVLAQLDQGAVALHLLFVLYHQRRGLLCS